VTTDLIDRIRDDHELIRARFTQLLDAPPTQREGHFRELVSLLVQHEAVESIVLHPTVEDEVSDGRRIADARREEEQEAERRLAELESMDPTSDVFVAAIEALRTEVEEHAQAEEREELPKLREELDAETLEQLGQAYERLRAVAPTRPHPESGQGPIVNALAGPIVGLVDRVRDALRSVAEDEQLVRASAGSGGHAYEDRSVDELRQRAAELDIEGRSSMDKTELIAALRRANG
jgi:hypothetical protein